MASLSVFGCPGESQSLVQVSAEAQAAACSNGQGAWQQVVIAEPFDPASLNSPELAGAFGAGFVVLGTGLAIAWAARMLISAVRNSI